MSSLENIEQIYKQLEDEKSFYRNYTFADGKLIFVNPDYNLLNGNNISGKYILFCPQLMDEECFVYFSNAFHSKRNIRCNYRKVFDYLLSFSFISMLVYSLSCSSRTSENNFLILGNWIPKSIIRDVSDINNQISFDDNGNAIYWNKYSTVRYIKESEKKDMHINYLSGTVISDYLKCVDIKRTKLIPVVRYDEEINSEYYETRKVMQKSLYKPTEKLWNLVDKAKQGKITFIAIERDKIFNLFNEKIRVLAHNSSKSKNYERIKRIYLDDIKQEIVKKYSGWRRIGEILPFTTLHKGTRDKLENSIPVTPVELCLRELIEGEIETAFKEISLDIDNFYSVKKPRCTFENENGYDETTYFEFDPDILINELKENVTERKYDERIVYQIYEILSRCEEYRKKYYFKVNYLRRENGRFYGVRNYVQNMPRALRKLILSKYQSVDMNCGVYSLLLNIAKKMNYKGDTTEIQDMVADRKKYRENLIDDDLGIDYDDVKDKLTMISFGCKMNVNKMISSSEYEYMFGEDENHIPYHTCLYRGEDAERKLNISKWCSKENVMNLHNEIDKLGRFLIKKYIIKKDSNKILKNSIGNVMLINNKTRHSFGEKLAFIYQSEESMVLKSIVDNFTLGNRKINSINGGIGLLLHDAVYIHKNIVKKYNNIAEKMSDYVKDNFGYDIKYETE